MRVLVTGGAGYIGSHAIRQLRRNGHDPVVFDNFSAGHREVVDGFEMIEGDITDHASVQRALQGIDGIMHFAAFISVGESVTEPRKYYENNTLGAFNLINAAVEAGVKNFIFSSTAAVYGNPIEVPIRETHPREPINPYGASKLAVERILEAYSTAYGLRFAALRYFNAAGADEDGTTGELHDPETHLIPLALQAALGLVPELKVFGNDYDTPDGTCIRDYIHVTDLSDAHVLALEYLARGGESQFMNLGNGRGFTVQEVITTAEKVTGKRVPHCITGRRAGDPPALVASSDKARQVLGWKPSRSLETMISTAWQWLQKTGKQSVSS